MSLKTKTHERFSKQEQLQKSNGCVLSYGNYCLDSFLSKKTLESFINPLSKHHHCQTHDSFKNIFPNRLGVHRNICN